MPILARGIKEGFRGTGFCCLAGGLRGERWWASPLHETESVGPGYRVQCSQKETHCHS